MDQDTLNLEIFRLLRDQIEHEDELIHQRVTWLLTIHGFLFTAYGFLFTAYKFSLPPQGTLPVNIFFTAPIPEGITQVRTILACLALGVSLVMLCGTGAAAIAILKCIGAWTSKSDDIKNKFPPIVSGFRAGACAGLLPAYLLPIVTALAWYFLANDAYIVRYFAIAITLATAIVICLMLWASVGSRVTHQLNKNQNI